MRRGELRIEYDCQSTALSVDRVGLPQVFSSRPDDFDPPTAYDDKTTEFSFTGSRKRTTVFGTWYEGKLRFPQVSGDRLPLLTEFIESVRQEREFVIRADHLPGVMRPLSVFVPSNRYPISRIRNCDKYSISLTYRTIGYSLNSGTPNSVSASTLKPGIKNTQSYGVGSVDNSVIRYAYFIFDDTEADRVLKYDIQSNSEVIVTVNGSELYKHNGASKSKTHTVLSSMQNAGTNSLRFECVNADGNWKVSGVEIS